MALLDRIRAKFSKPQTAPVASEQVAGLSGFDGMHYSGFESRYNSSVLPDASAAASVATEEDYSVVDLPWIGRHPASVVQSASYAVIALSAISFVVLSAWAINRSNNISAQVAASGEALMQSQRLAKSVSLAMLGDEQGIADVKDSHTALNGRIQALKEGNAGVPALGKSYQPAITALHSQAQEASSNAETILKNAKVLASVGRSLRTVNRQSSDLLEKTETISALKLAQGAGKDEISVAANLSVLTQRIGKSVNEFLTSEGVSPEGIFLLGKDLGTFKEQAQGLLNGSSDLRLPPTADGETREQLDALLRQFEEMQQEANVILDNFEGLVASREANTNILKQSEGLRLDLQKLQNRLSHAGGLGGVTLFLLLPALLAALAIWLLVRLQVRESSIRHRLAEAQKQDAQRQEQEAKRVNDANQAAILRLMNELQSVAEGDLTQEATVTEDITGAIADSVNYTIEELRSLVGNVQNTAARVVDTTSSVEGTSTELLAASTEQLREIRETGQSVLDMAGRITEVSSRAQESAGVARQSLQAAEEGLTAVQDTIGGMNAIREQIQETSKRIKRLGESSQEIGEMTELISDITEQTNVLALNAAIQAASAGEAGRGFSVVAEEVQRLAERSADATQQIAALVKTIQTDTKDAVAAMERSTQGVVEGAALSDNAGMALTEIDRISRQLAQLIESISQAASKEADSASHVASNIQHIFAVTEQTSAGTQATAEQVRELNRVAEELHASVARFKIV